MADALSERVQRGGSVYLNSLLGCELAPEKRSPWLIVYNQLWGEFNGGTSTGAIHA